MFGLLGETLGHSFSPQIHAQLGTYEYRLFEVRPENIPAFFHERAFDGINVTIPYKKTVIPYCAELSDRAKRIGSVNTLIKRTDATLYGDNTDYDGFDSLLYTIDFDPKGKKAVVLGSGGSSVTVRAVLEDRNAKNVVIVSRSGPNNYNNLSLHQDAALIVNTTPVGMYPKTGVSPISLDTFPACEAVIDIIYNPAKTQLLLDAEAKEIPCINGLKMLVSQAKRASELFTGNKVGAAEVDRITDLIAKQTMNIVLIGMPGCGKTTVGKALATLTEREFLDTDTLIAQIAGRTIPEIIEADGEPAFRKLETEVLSECAKQSGKVIATGGGIVTIDQNLPLIRQNSLCVFLRRDLHKLSSQGRPLSKKFGVETLYKERLPLYREYGEFEIDSNQSIHDTAEAIKEALQL